MFTTPLLDDFNRADANPASGSWAQMFTSGVPLAISSNTLRKLSNTPAQWSSYYTASSGFGHNIEVYATLAGTLAASQSWGLAVCNQDPTDPAALMFLFEFSRDVSNTWQTLAFYKISNDRTTTNVALGTWTVADVVPSPDPVIGDKLGVRVRGLAFDWTLEAWWYDTTGGNVWRPVAACSTVSLFPDPDPGDPGYIGVELNGGTPSYGFDDFSGGTISAFAGATADLTVTAAPPVTEPEGRFLLAFDQPTLQPDPDWTRLDDHPNLVTSYTIDRGRQYELDRTDTGRATVQIIDPDGILDPTNPDGPYYGQIQPLVQAAISRHNPVTDEWTLRYRGFVSDYDYTVDPSQRLSRLTVSLVDLFEILSSAELQPGEYGDTPPEGSEGQVYYQSEHVHNRITRILKNVGLAKRFWVVLPGSVLLQKVVYSPGETALSACQEAADGELQAVATVFCDRKGRFVFHDRPSKFDPAGVAAAVGAAKWDYHEWDVGDGAAIVASTNGTVQIREFAFNRGLSKIINSATATPAGIEDDDVAGQLVVNAVSVGLYGVRSWSAEGLLTKSSTVDGANSLDETRRVALFYASNYAQPLNRITQIGFRPLRPDDDRAPALWEFLNTVDIHDTVTVTVTDPGGGGLTSVSYFVEGIHEDVKALVPDYDDVTLRLDLSDRAYYTVNPWA